MALDPSAAVQRRNVALFVSVSLISGFGGTAMSLVAGIWVMTLTGSPSLAALAGFCVFLPTLFGPVLGTVVDRLPRRPLLIWTNLLVAASLLTLLAVRSAGHIWLVYLVMLTYGISYVLLDAGEAALLPAALPEDALGKVNGMRMSAQEGTKLLAPLVGAGLFAVVGGPAVALLAAATLVIAALLYRFVQAREPRPAAERRHVLRETWDGIRFLHGHAPLRAIVLVAAVAVTMSGLTSAAIFAVVDEGLHRPAPFLGVLSSAQGAGAIAGGLLVGRLMSRWSEAAIGTLGALLFAVGTAARLAPSAPAVVASSFVVGVGLPWTVIVAMTAVQRRTPHNLLGRVAATANTLVFGPTALAIPAGAVLIAVVDYRVALVAAALLTGISGVWLTGLSRTGPADPDQPARGDAELPDDGMAADSGRMPGGAPVERPDPMRSERA